MQELDEQLDPELRAVLDRYGFDRTMFEVLRTRMRAGRAEERDNRIGGRLMPPLHGDVGLLPPLASDERARLHLRGVEQIHAGQVAVVVLAGGMATRFGGVVKAEVEVFPGRSFLDLKLADIAQLESANGGRVPVYVMTSFATHERVSALCERARAGGLEVQTFPQFVSLRLTERGELFRGKDGKPSPYAPGHGDLLPALQRAGIVRELEARGVRHVFMSNVDNLAATLDPAIIGAHDESRVDLSFEVVPLWPGDRGGVPARVNGRLHLVEAVRYPANFDERSIPLFSINSFVFSSALLARSFDLSFYRVAKKVDGRTAVQFERLVNQLVEYVRARGLLVEREGTAGRFLPVKDPAELEARRSEIETVLKSRGISTRDPTPERIS